MVLIIVRHSERIDEVDKVRWNQIKEANAKARSKALNKAKSLKTDDTAKVHFRDDYSFAHDPILTENGISIAADSGVTIKNLLETSYPSCRVKLYSSKLIRSVQTAHQISLALGNIPIHLSSGVASVAAAVKKKINQGQEFQLMTHEETSRYCPDVKLIDVDDVIPKQKSKSALRRILSLDEGDSSIIHLVVAHRETLRSLAGCHLKTPYCVIGIFCTDSNDDLLKDSSSVSVSAKDSSSSSSLPETRREEKEKKVSFKLQRTFDKDGNLINTCCSII